MSRWRVLQLGDDYERRHSALSGTNLRGLGSKFSGN